MMGILIRALDGEGIESNSGLHGKRGYTGDYLFMILSASTPIRPRIWKIMGNLGSRLFFVNLNSSEKDEKTLAGQLKFSCKDKETSCRKATERFLKTLWNKYPKGIHWDKNEDNQDLIEIIARFSKILARLRSSINVEGNQFNDKDEFQVITEMPDRLNQLLYNLARGHALVCDRERIERADLKIVARVALDSAPPGRAKLFRHLIGKGGNLSTNEVVGYLECSRPTALKLMREIEVLKLANSEGDLTDNRDCPGGRPEQRIILNSDYSWFISEEFKKIIN